MSDQDIVTSVKALKEMGPPPEGHYYAAGSLAYWSKNKNAFKAYSEAKWDSSDGQKQQVLVEIVPDVDSLRFHQGRTCSWDVDEHPADCEHCRVIFRRLKS
jgi:hypothetical protein